MTRMCLNGALFCTSNSTHKTPRSGIVYVQVINLIITQQTLQDRFQFTSFDHTGIGHHTGCIIGPDRQQTVV